MIRMLLLPPRGTTLRLLHSTTPSISSSSRLVCRGFSAATTTTEQEDDNDTSLSSIPSSSSSSTSTTITSFLNRVRIETSTSGIAHVVLSRPDKLNALDLDMFRALVQAGNHVRDNPAAIRAVVLSGQGRAFCTGLDVPSFIQQMGKQWPTQLLQQLLQRPHDHHDNNTTSTTAPSPANLVQQVCYQWRELPVPVVAALHGMCYGGGLQLALGADVRIAAPDCRLSIMETKWGLIPDMGASITLRELVRIDVAKELTFLGRVVDGTEAHALGLVTHTASDPLKQAHAWAQAVVQQSPDAVATAKELYQRTWTAVSEEDCLLVETDLQKQLVGTWNQLAAAGRNWGWKIPYWQRRKRKQTRQPPLESPQNTKFEQHPQQK